jgi:L-rhamnose mutarotase
LGIYLDLPRNELQAMTALKARFTFDRIASVAAMQEWARHRRKIVAIRDIRSDFLSSVCTTPDDLASSNRASSPAKGR